MAAAVAAPARGVRARVAAPLTPQQVAFLERYRPNVILTLEILGGEERIWWAWRDETLNVVDTSLADMISLAEDAALDPVSATVSLSVLELQIEHTPVMGIRWSEANETFSSRVVTPPGVVGPWTPVSDDLHISAASRILEQIRTLADNLLLNVFARRAAAAAALRDLLPVDDVLNLELAPFISYHRRRRRSTHYHSHRRPSLAHHPFRL